MCLWELRYCSVYLRPLCALHDTPTTHLRTFPMCKQRNFPARGGYWASGLLFPSGLSSQMLCTDFICHPGTGSTGSRPNTASLNSTTRAQQGRACCSWLAQGGPEDIPPAKAKRSLC